jgi:hypothetical protein
MNMKHFICVILLIGSLSLIGCDKNTPRPWDSEEIRKAKKLKLKQQEEEFLEQMQDVQFYFDREIIALLCYKYSIQEETVSKLLKDYKQSAIESAGSSFANVLEGKTITNEYKEALDKLSKQHDISKEKLASIIIDYTMFTKDTSP